MAPSLVDNLAVRALHRAGLQRPAQRARRRGSPTSLRRPEEIGDLSNAGRRKMPALMRNADGRGARP